MMIHQPLQRTSSTLSFASANTIAVPSSTGMIRPAAASRATSRRTFMILLKAFAPDKAEIKKQMEEAGTPVRRSLSASDSETETENPNDFLINWTLKTYNVDPRKDMVILANVRPMAASTKTKWYDTSIAAYAQMFDAEEREKSIKLLQKYLDALWARGYQCRALAMLGDKREEVCNKAIEESVDNIIVGQRRKQKGLRIGMRTHSFAANLMMVSETPVAVVKLPAES
ncbi:hypothetical protein EC988_000627 [Linderina pennispora]|nr:hypothetical protein EC988_000627 [Linderina pennispora]